MSLLIVGSMAFDDIVSPFGESDQIVGGSASFFTLAASQFITDINLVAVVGGDFPKEFIQEFKDKGINTEGLQIKEDQKTFYWKGKYYDNMNKRDSLVTELNVLENFDPLIPESYAKSDYVMLGNLQPSVQKLVIDRMAEKPKFIALDTMNFWMDIAMPELKVVLKMIDCIIVNDEEARQLTGEYHLKIAAKKIMEMGPQTVIIKKGEHGALLFNDGKQFFAPALPLEVVFDPTGAGDSFAGGFCGYLAATNDLSFENQKRAIIYGSALASFCVEKFGTERLRTLQKEEMKERIEEFVQLTDFSMT